MTTIIGIKLDNRIFTSIDFQKVLTDFGCQIRTRIGLHHTNENSCSNFGIILLEVDGETKNLIEKLTPFGNVKSITF